MKEKTYTIKPDESNWQLVELFNEPTELALARVSRARKEIE